MICVLLAEACHWLLDRVVPALVGGCHLHLASEAERLTFALLAAAQSLAPLGASVALITYKVLLTRQWVEAPPPIPATVVGLGEPLLWEADKGWYLHAAPVVVFWCLIRWCAAPAFALGIRCGCVRRGHRMLIWERYKSLLCIVSVSVIFQSLVPVL